MEAFGRTLYSNYKDGYDIEFLRLFALFTHRKILFVDQSSVPDPDVFGLPDPHPDP